MVVNSDTMNQIIVKHAWNKKNPTDVLLIFLHFAEELPNVTSDSGKPFDQQLKHIITEFADITEESRGLPPRRGDLDHNMKLTSYPPQQRRNNLSVPVYKK
jgi:hypothetical protein